MSQVVSSMSFSWKEFNVSLVLLETWLRENAGAGYCGNCASGASLELYFIEEPSQEIKDAVQAYWDGLEDDSAEASDYKSQEQINADVEAKKASAKAKLLALGLTEDEVNALVGA